MFYRLEFDFASDTIMEFPVILKAEDGHRDRAQNVQPVIPYNLDRSNHDFRNTIVRLQFTFGGNTRHGTGFFVNLPSPSFDVILTAAHNLIDGSKNLASDLKVIYADNDEDLVTEFRICPQYVDILGTRPKSDVRAIYDYGVILLPKDEKKRHKRQGLGLSLELSSNDTLLKPGKEVRVYGYGETAGGDLLESSGPLNSATSQLEYQAPTEPGMSGSPVWIPYGGQQVAVGIHNMRPKESGSGSRGARITDQVFRQLCLWAGGGFFNRRLCAVGKGPDGKPTHNTYLSFSRHCDFAKVFLGSSEAASSQDNLSFDILPATIPPSWAVKPSPLWAFKFHTPSGWKDKEKCWVEWQPAKQRAVLVDTMKEVNLCGKKPFRVVIPMANETNNQELRLYDDDRDEEDIEDGMTDFAGVSFADQGDKGIMGKGLFVID
ncbi:hypothetical protein BBK36DRAFT_1187439 [Trichoderma citrinoviride]|uniref:Serine protease n=1 Tax=Trichoderma citrinoviride TaxID=58853 RepID=A0A2T4BJT8_9HYPO|nr:hypothetical protein BBK36DRAFT_1187439 [Trichoderma citrinoviride]PTB69529.1 hypothetical protein BBK36DRAFT_1187439 [Trichoderma citrinoviride]